MRRLARLRVERDNEAVAGTLRAVRTAADSQENLLIPMKAALAARATVGEVCDALREVWGTYKPSETL